MNPYIILAIVIAFAVTNAGSYFKGHSNGSESVQVKWDKAVADQAEKERKQADGAITKLETGNAKAKVVYRTITNTVDKVVEKPVYRNVCLESDGLLLANQALTGTLTPTGKPDDTLPRLKPPSGRYGIGNLEKIGGGQ